MIALPAGCTNAAASAQCAANDVVGKKRVCNGVLFATPFRPRTGFAERSPTAQYRKPALYHVTHADGKRASGQQTTLHTALAAAKCIRLTNRVDNTISGAQSAPQMTPAS